ncbi:hypothetical protein MYX84_15570 [Acidobacteria bacterium AH-259-O06]|nr:hypothetical protein [Acidobacteria bacterium AH-259-O06]
MSFARLEHQGFKGALEQALRFGIPGAFGRTRLELGSLSGWVNTFNGTPTILRSTKFPEMVERKHLARTFSHYFDRLAFECALSGHKQGRIVIYYESLEGDKFMVYDVRFKNLERIAAEAERRLYLLESGTPAQELPPCPLWMAKFCPFSPGCGCTSA